MRIGIDLGGTKIEGIALDSQGIEIYRERIPTPSGDYQATIQAIFNLVHSIENTTKQTGSVGIGIPGTVSPATGLVKNANSTCLIGNPLTKDLEDILHRPIRLANDANCFAVSEAVDGNAQGAEMVFGVILGTGVGGGIAYQGQTHTGINAIAGEWGHNPLPWPTDDERPGPECYCGKQGCIETFLSGPGLALDHHTNGGDMALDATDIAELAKNDHPQAYATIKRYEERLARGLASIINILDPDVIVLGGGISNISSLYQNVPVLWQQWVFSDQADTKLVPNKHGDSSGVRGAAWLWPQD